MTGIPDDDPPVTITLTLATSTYRLLAALVEPDMGPVTVDQVLDTLVDHVQQGVYRPGAWEREWLCQVFGSDWLANLEADPERQTRDGRTPWTRTRTDAPGLGPSMNQVRAWLTAQGWTASSDGSAGALWFPPDGPDSAAVGVLHRTSDRDEIRGVLERIGNRLGLPWDEVARAVLTYKPADDDGHRPPLLP